MLSDDVPSVRVSQPTFACIVCGIVENKSGPNQKFCKQCRPERRLQYSRDYQRLRPKRGRRALGEVVRCVKCDAAFELRFSKHKFCVACAKPKHVIKLALGQTFGCANCSTIVIKSFRRQCYCSACHELVQRHQMPAYKTRKSIEHSRRYRSDPEYRARRNANVLKGQNVKYATDPAFAINVRMRTGIGASIAGQKRGRRWESLVGYTLSDLMLHLERQFLPGMLWDNRSAWHVDHILPLSMFKFRTAEDAEFRAAWALSNLRPIWMPDNLNKWATRTHLI